MKIRISSIFLWAAVILFIGCSDGNDSAPGPDTGRMTIKMTDAPFPHNLVAEANVTVFKIEARHTDKKSGPEKEGEMGDKNGSPFIVLMEQEIDVNLLDLTNGITETLVDTEVPVGTYDLVRVYVKGINVVLVDGTTYDLKVPSGEQSGIKIFIKPGITVAGNLSADLLLDFDVSRSFVAKGNIKDPAGITGFNFKPVIKASNLSTAGSLSGVVTMLQEATAIGLEGAQVSVFAADTLNTATFTDATGSYMVMGLLAGTYDVTVDLEGYGTQTVEGVKVNTANQTITDFELVPIAGAEVGD
ncbi:MAG TPA: DUF4382 domain-containing protein [Arenibacter sp.]|nr:DUF4382 domain-containing protein [Arenibacter sp.]